MIRKQLGGSYHTLETCSKLNAKQRIWSFIVSWETADLVLAPEPADRSVARSVDLGWEPEVSRADPAHLWL